METNNLDNYFSKAKASSILYNQYENYPSVNRNGWMEYLFDHLEKEADNTYKVFTKENDSIILIELNNSEWDFKHFEFSIGRVSNPVVINNCTYSLAQKAIKKTINFCKSKGIKVIIVRVNGDNLTLIHALHSYGFKYYENIIWPVVDLEQIDLNKNTVSFFNPLLDNIDDIKHIAIKDQYQRGHYHCDDQFDKNLVNSMYAKWVQTAFSTKKKIAIIKHDKSIAGYFICDIDRQLSSFLGTKYGRLQSLAIDSSFRGKGLGKKLFEGTLFLLKKEGCRYVDSGYATKNHMSARLHMEHKFFSIYEEITFHLWT